MQNKQTVDANGARGVLPSERRQSIVNEIIRRHTVTIIDLARQFGVSEMTIRRDLHELEKTGIVESVHGSAKSASLSPFELSYAQREIMEADAKRAIGQAAATLVEQNDVIALDGSTTTLQVARNLIDRGGLTVYTNGIKVATELAHRPVGNGGVEVSANWYLTNSGLALIISEWLRVIISYPLVIYHLSSF